MVSVSCRSGKLRSRKRFIRRNRHGEICIAPRHSAAALLASRRLALHNGTMNEIYARLEEIFRTVLQDDALTITPETSGKDFEGWDSLTHVTLMVHAERAFGIQFTNSEIAGWQNAGELAQLIEARLKKKA